MSYPSPPETATLLVACGDRTGLVAALSDFIFRNGGNIQDADQHSERESGLFFMRLVWDLGKFRLDRDATRKALEALAGPLGMEWQIFYSSRKPRVAIFSGSTHHCLYDLLLCRQIGDLDCDIPMVISNHGSCGEVARHFSIPFTHTPVTPETRAGAEAAQTALLDRLEVDLIVLARYMQVLSPAFPP